MEREIPFENSNRENGPTFLDFPLFPGIFQWDEPRKRVSFTAEPEIPEFLTKWKAPKDSRIFFQRCTRKYQSLPYQHIRARELFSNPFYKGICILLARPFPTVPAERSIHLANTPF